MSCVQIQSVLYKNNKESILRSLESIRSAYHFEAERKDGIAEMQICYGDASPNPVFDDATIDVIEETMPKGLTLSYTFFNENTGTAKGHNLLSQGCKKKYISIINPDIIITPTFFERMSEPFYRSDMDVGLVEARQTPIEHPKRYDSKTGFTSWASTAAVLIDTEAFLAVGGFDEDTFFMYCDDVDFSWRLRALGKSIVYQPRAPVFHAKRLTAEGAWQPTEAEIYYSAEAQLLMAYKWSREDLCNQIESVFLSSGSKQLEKAANAFIERKSRGEVPEQIDADNSIGTFVDYNYTEHRFVL